MSAKISHHLAKNTQFGHQTNVCKILLHLAKNTWFCQHKKTAAECPNDQL